MNEKFISILLVSTLVLLAINTCLLTYLIFTSFRRKIEVHVISISYPLPEVTFEGEFDCLAILKWKSTPGKYIPILPDTFETSRGAILELVWINQKPPKTLPPLKGEFTAVAAFRIIKGEVKVGDTIRPSRKIITIPEACLPEGVVICVIKSS